jgi:hypothetical protein
MVANVITGKTSDFKFDGFASEGKIFRFTENIQIKIIPSQKAGMDNPKSERIETIISGIEYWCVAEMIPAGIERITERIRARMARSAVFGKRSSIVLKTGRFDT